MTEKNIRYVTAVKGDSQSLYFNGSYNNLVRISIESGYYYGGEFLSIYLHSFIYVFFMAQSGEIFY